MTALRRIAYPLGLAWRRLARRGDRVVLVAVGIAAGAALLAAVLAGSLVAQDRSVTRAVARVAPTDRVVRVTWGGIASGPGTNVAELDRRVRGTLAPLVDSPTRAMLFRTTQAQGHLFDLGAVDGLARYVHVRSGRLPQPCRRSRCELLQLGGSGPVPKIPGLTLAVVGRATLDSPVPFGTLITRETYASILSSSLRYHTTATPPLLLAEGVGALARVPVFVPSYRSYTWTAPLGAGDVHPWTIDDFDQTVTQTRSKLQAESLAFDVTAPVAALRQADEDGRVAGRRLLLIGGEAAALLLAFAVLAATGLRRDTAAQWQRLTWYGARRWQLALSSVAEAGVVALAGAVAGWAVGAAAGAFVAARADVPVADVLRHSVVDGRGIALALGLAVAAAAVVVLALLGSTARVAIDVAALGAACAIAVALARGAADTQTLADERGTGAVLLLLPALIAFVAAVVCARALAPLLRVLERRARSASVPVRLAALSLARNPGRAAVAVAFLVVSLGLALFAEVYRATLTRGQSDQAAFAAPTDFILREDLTKLVPVSQAPRPRGDAIPVLRLSANVPRLEPATGLTLLGIPAEDVEKLRWRGDYSPLSQADIAQRLRPHGGVELQGARLPASGRRLVLPWRASGDELAVRAVVVTRSGAARGLPLGATRAQQLAADIPADARGGLLVSFTFTVTGTGLHGVPNAGINAQAVARGTMRLGAPLVDGRALAFDVARWRGSGGITLAGPHTLRYLVTGDAVARLRAQQPTDDHPVAVVASPRLAAAAGPGGVLPLTAGAATIVTRVVGEVARAPTVDGDVVLADGPTITTALAATAPGSGTPNELWLNSSSPPHAAVLDVMSHDATLRELRGEPLARGTLITLIAAAATALVLALVGLLLIVVSDLRDERGELFDLEAQGATPATLRHHLRLRAALAAGFGLLGGLATGAVLAAIVVALVTLTAGGGSTDLPLLLDIDWLVALSALVVFLAAAALLVMLATQRAFRAEVAGRFAEVGT